MGVEVWERVTENMSAVALKIIFQSSYFGTDYFFDPKKFCSFLNILLLIYKRKC